MRQWSILLEMPPIAKGRPKFGRNGAYTPGKTRKAESEAKALMRSQFIMQPLSGPLRLQLDFVFAKPQKPKHNHWHIVRPDADNLSKLIKDAGNGILWIDDSQVCEMYVRKFYASEGQSPRVVLTVSILDAVK